MIEFLDNPYLAGFVGSIPCSVLCILLYDLWLKRRMRRSFFKRQAFIQKEQARLAHLEALGKSKKKGRKP